MQVLELGCGNSQLSEELYRDGVTNVTCIDLSAVAVEKKKKQLLSKGLKGALVESCKIFIASYRRKITVNALDNSTKR